MMLGSLCAAVRPVAVSGLTGARVGFSGLRAVCAAAPFSTTASVLAGPSRGNVSATAYPAPTLSIQSHEDFALGARHSNLAPTRKQGHRLNEYERKVANLGKKHGYIRMVNHCTTDLCNRHLRYCYARQRPYMAISAHGDKLVVDLSPVGGVGKSPDDSRVYKVMQGWQTVLKEIKPTLKGGLQVSNLESRPEAEELPGFDIFFKDERKDADTEISDQFTVLVAKRADAEAVASALWRWFAAEFDDLTPEQADELKAEKNDAKIKRWEMLMRRQLRRLVADPKAMRRIPYGALDGFIKADKEGNADKY